ncbi:MAG: hypothetical protein ACFFCQ_09790, partial [Promethearchaeota archaeon]
MSTDNLRKLTEILERLNDFFLAPICTSHLTNLSKHIQLLNKLSEEIKSASMFQKRKLKKEFDDTKENLLAIEEKCLNCIFDGILKELKPRIDKQIQSLITLHPQTSRLLKGLKFPLTAEIDPISNFIDEIQSAQQDVLTDIRKLCQDQYLTNTTKIDTFKDLVTFDLTSYPKTNQLSSETIDLMKLDELIRIIPLLKKEDEELNKQLSTSKTVVQEKLLQMIHELNSAVQEGNKRGLVIEIINIQEISGLAEKIKTAVTIDELNQFNTIITQNTLKLSSFFKSEMNRIRADGNNLVASIRNMFPTLTAKWISAPPEISTTPSTLSEIVRNYDVMNNWQNQILEGIKHVVSLDEITQVTEGALQEGLAISNTLIVNLKELSKEIRESDDVTTAISKLKIFHSYYNEYLSAIKNEISSILNFDATDVVSSALISLKPPTVNFTSDSPSELLTYLRTVNQWKSKLVNVLQETRHSINDTLAIVSQLQKKGFVTIPSNLESEFKELYNKLETQTDIPQLLNHRRTYDKLYTQVGTLAAASIKDFLRDVTIIQVLEVDGVEKPPFIGDISELELSDILLRIEEVEAWKESVLTTLRRNVESMNFPLIPGEVPIDLRKEKNHLINQLSSVAAARNSIASIRAYFDFINTLNSSTGTMIEETRNQISLSEKIDTASMKYFKETVSTGLMFEMPKDVELLDYSELLELWHRLRTYNKKKSELIQLKCRQILSSWLKQYKSLPTQYLSFFNDLFIILEHAINELNPSLDAESTLNKFEFFIDNSTNKALEALEKLKSQFYNKVVISLPRIIEVMGNV